MTGLLVKDFRLLAQRKQALLLFLGIAVLMSFTTGGTFIIGYFTFLALVMVVGTISYDEFDNGYCFLMTLPITPRVYAVEKYVMSTCCGVVSWIAALVIATTVDMLQHNEISIKEEVIGSLTIWCVMFLIMDLMIPIQVKFGAEKSRVVMIACMGLLGASILIGNKIMEKLNIEPVPALDSFFNNVPDLLIAVGFLVVVAVCTYVSMAISTRIMERKEF